MTMLGGRIRRFMVVGVLILAGAFVAPVQSTQAAACSDITKLENQISSLEVQLNKAQQNLQSSQAQAGSLQTAIGGPLP
ncbi:MAG TPA: hypothetical protein VMQ44_02530, partial [Candidatus Saccharimonadales bacterium]|nr:hypothetical protein [Candidatus Saccharimonadales bacterium]